MTAEAPPVTRDSAVTLREVTEDTVRTICDLSKTLTETQRTHVADNAVSIAEAHFSKHAWFRAIYADETPVGFLMLYIGPDDEQPGEPTVWFLWRLMVAGPYQKMGFGRRALEQVFDTVREQGASEFITSCVPGEDGPERFYRRLGFTPNGKWYDEELGLVLKL
ncbi:MAG: GNAT family N-acetyltransferase [Anaerolineae bacterium]|jgi:diamine N-acetyltransferase|nr:GNAT family N-acetyltransferase [Anaerolineae bacterium]